MNAGLHTGALVLYLVLYLTLENVLNQLRKESRWFYI